jgi:hypothetical protein
LYAKTISRTISVISEPLLNEEQNSMDSMFASQLLERHREYDPGTRLLFTDNVKAFDLVLRKNIMGNSGRKWVSDTFNNSHVPKCNQSYKER